ncbi:MAG: hypothetical protein AAGE86_07340, partial [Pseudomonadota bacterium]
STCRDAAQGRIVTFDFPAFLDHIADWHSRREQCRLIELTPIERPITPSQRTGMSTSTVEKHPFNRARRAAFALRRRVFGTG